MALELICDDGGSMWDGGDIWRWWFYVVICGMVVLCGDGVDM